MKIIIEIPDNDISAFQDRLLESKGWVQLRRLDRPQNLMVEEIGSTEIELRWKPLEHLFEDNK